MKLKLNEKSWSRKIFKKNIWRLLERILLAIWDYLFKQENFVSFDAYHAVISIKRLSWHGAFNQKSLTSLIFYKILWLLIDFSTPSYTFYAYDVIINEKLFITF